MVVWTIPSLGVSQLKLIRSAVSMQVFPWEQDRGVRPTFPLPDKAIHTHTHAYVYTHACYHLIRVSQLSSVTGTARNTMTPLRPQTIFRGRVWEEIQGQMARDRDGQSFLFQWTPPGPLIPPKPLRLFREISSERKVTDMIRWTKIILDKLENKKVKIKYIQ